MSSIHSCTNSTDAVVLHENHDLYLKPIACINIVLQLPVLKSAGRSISNWEIMDKIRSSAKPDEFTGMKVMKSTLEFVRIEAQLESKHQIAAVLQRLDRSFFRLNGFPDPIKIIANETKVRYPSRHDWDTFFQESKNMNEMKPGERPDTVHVSMLPCQWFSMSSFTGNQKVKPSETILREVFEVFGPLRAVDIPMLDPYRSNIISNSKNTFAFEQDGLFEAYVQYQEYSGFMKCMTLFKGMKLLLKRKDHSHTALIQVDFDRTRHLSDGAIKERRAIREKCIREEIDRQRTDLEIAEKEETRHQIKDDSMKEEKSFKEKNEQDQVASEERKLISVQRKLESLRLLDALLERIKASVEEKEREKKKAITKNKEKSKKEEKEVRRQRRLEEKEKLLRFKLVRKYQEVEQQRLEEQREKLRKTVQNLALKLKSTVSVVPESKTSTQVDFTEERVVSYSAKDSGSVHSANTDRSNAGDRWHNSSSSCRYSSGDQRSSYSKSSNRKMEYVDSRPNHHSSYNQSRSQEPNQNHHHHDDGPLFSRKRNVAQSFQDRSSYQSNRKLQKKSHWVAKLDDELWDGPKMNSDSHRYPSHDTFRPYNEEKTGRFKPVLFN